MDCEDDGASRRSSETEENYRRSLVSLHRNLRQETLCNIESSKASSNDNSDHTKQLYAVYCQLFDHLENIDGVMLEILDFAPQYDFNDHKANGYRSQVKVTQKCLTMLMALVRHITVNRDSYLFRRGHYIRELESYVMVLGQLRDVLHYTRKLIDYTAPGQLIPDDTLLDSRFADEIQMEMDKIDQEWFYGRPLGFQYCSSLKKALEVVHVGLATYSHSYQTKPYSAYTKLAGSLLTSSQYVLNPEYRARKVVEVTLSCDIEFCKAFWNLPESDLLHGVASFALPICPVNHVFKVDTPDLQLKSVLTGNAVTISSPRAHIGSQPLQLRLLSHTYRQGQERLPGFPKQTSGPAARSDYLIFQCHGGGFVSQTSRTHEAYLRHWANDTKVPILCVDYSLAPQAPFPRALEETFYAYCWALANKHLLGTTAKRIAIVGDSAGGNLLLATMLKAIEAGIRLPNGIVCIYTPVYIQYIPSASRSLSVMDALLPVGILTKCLEAYAGDQLEPYKIRDDVSAEPDDSNKDGVTAGESLNSNAVSCPDVTNLLQQPPWHDDDEEVATLLSNDSPSLDQSETASTTLNTQSKSAKPCSSARESHQSVTSVEDLGHRLSESGLAPSSARPRRGGHRRSTHLVHSRSGSMPVSRPHLQRPDVLTSHHDKNRHFAQSPLYKFSRVKIRQNPYLSPLLADDSLLSRMPPTYMVAAHLDPCLDDSVTFAKRLDSLGVEVHLDAIDDVPHGFLNFAVISDECRQATNLCKDRLKQALKLPTKRR